MISLVAFMYLADVVNSIGSVLFIVTLALIILLIIFGVNYSDTYMEEVDKRDILLNAIKKYSKGLATCLLILVILPSSRTMNVLIAGVAVKELSTVQSVNVIGSKAMKVIDTYLDKVIKENIEEENK